MAPLELAPVAQSCCTEAEVLTREELERRELEELEREREYRRNLITSLREEDVNVAREINAELFPSRGKATPRSANNMLAGGLLASTPNVIRCTDANVRPSANWRAHVAFEDFKASAIFEEHTARRDLKDGVFGLLGAGLQNNKRGLPGGSKEYSQASSRSGSMSSRQSSRSSGSHSQKLHQAGHNVIQSGGRVYNAKC